MVAICKKCGEDYAETWFKTICDGCQIDVEEAYLSKDS